MENGIIFEIKRHTSSKAVGKWQVVGEQVEDKYCLPYSKQPRYVVMCQKLDEPWLRCMFSVDQILELLEV